MPTKSALGYKKAYLREVVESDADLILDWVNDPEDRANSLSSHRIEKDEHMAWLHSSMDNPNRHLYMMVVDGSDVGHAKFDVDGNSAEVGYCIDPHRRGEGLSNVLMELLTDEIKRSFPSINTIVAYVKPSNMASRKALEHEGYKEALVRYELSV